MTSDAPPSSLFTYKPRKCRDRSSFDGLLDCCALEERPHRLRIGGGALRAAFSLGLALQGVTV
jgi:hypothetical protein